MCTSKKLLIPLMVFLSIQVTTPVYGVPPSKRAAQSGSIEFEQEAKPVDSYASSQEQALTFATSVNTAAQLLGTGGEPPPLPLLSDSAAKYLAAAYLYCSSNRGTCPQILDTVLESDIIESKRGGVAACPNTKKFWEMWLGSDMEKRQQFMIKTAHINLSSEFRKNIRPRYIKCEGTIQEELATGSSTSEYFKKRYGPGSSLPSQLGKTPLELGEIKEKVPNLFGAIGLN